MQRLSVRSGQEGASYLERSYKGGRYKKVRGLMKPGHAGPCNSLYGLRILF